MAHCQLAGPLHGPLRDRRRTELAKEHPVWELTRGFQADLMTTTQQIRRTPGLPSPLSGSICETLTAHSQLFNNAIREIVDDASEIRIQIEEANHALMTLKLQESTARHELSQMEKQIQEQVAKVEDTENRLAKYHNEAEKDRNAVREYLARLNDAEDAAVKEQVVKELLETLQRQLDISHSIWVEPKKQPTEYEKALAAVKEANPGFIPEDTAREGGSKILPMNPFDAGKYDPPQRATSLGSPMAAHVRNDLGNIGPPDEFPPGGSYCLRQVTAPNCDDAATEVFRPLTPQNQVSFGSAGAHASRPGTSGPMPLGTPGRPVSSMGNHNFRPTHNSLRAKAPEFYPGDQGSQAGNQGREDPNAFINQLAAMNLGPGRGFGDSPSLGHHSLAGGVRPLSSGGNTRAMIPYVSNDARVSAGLMGPDHFNHGPRRTQYGPNFYENRLVVARSQPTIPLGQMYGGISDDLGRFRVAFQELFSMARSFVATWVAQDGNQINRNAGVMQYLPKCYTGFTEQQAWSYIRQHLQDNLSRSCLFARVVVDFICERILVPSAWQGFDFQTDRRIQQLENEKNIGHIVTGNGRTAYTSAIADVLNVIIGSERYEAYRESRVEYFSRELETMLGPLMNQYANIGEALRDLHSMVGKAWSLSAKTLTSRMAFEYRFPDAGCRFSLQSMIAVAPNIDGYILQAEHWRVQLVVTPVITVRSDNGNTLSVDVTNLAEVLLMK